MNDFVKMIQHPLKFRLFLFLKLPSALFSGLRVKDMSDTQCVVTVPYRWFSKNPFKSTYFACLSMAAEMSTGALALGHIPKSIAVSTLVTGMEGEFFKKAKGVTRFICREGHEIRDAIQEAIDTGQPQTITVSTTGTDDEGELIASFRFSWSFKAKV